MNLSYLVSLPEWFNPWGWVGIGVIIVILLAILIALIVKSVKKGGAEEEEEGEPEYVEEGVAEEPAAEPAAKTEAEGKQPEPVAEPVAEEKTAAPAKTEKAVPAKAEKTEKAAPSKAEKAEEPAPAAVDGAPADEAPKAPKTPVKTYHISKRKDDNKWQVKAAGGSKAIKLFFTQAEAIEFAKKLAESQEARIVIHKEDGSFRRLNYKK